MEEVRVRVRLHLRALERRLGFMVHMLVDGDVAVVGDDDSFVGLGGRVKEEDVLRRFVGTWALYVDVPGMTVTVSRTGFSAAASALGKFAGETLR
jgi:hypothetical protein